MHTTLRTFMRNRLLDIAKLSLDVAIVTFVYIAATFLAYRTITLGQPAEVRPAIELVLGWAVLFVLLNGALDLRNLLRRDRTKYVIVEANQKIENEDEVLNEACNHWEKITKQHPLHGRTSEYAHRPVRRKAALQ